MQSDEKYVVLIITRDHEAFIADCLGSVLADPRQEFSIVVIDTGSLDKTYEIAKNFLTNSTKSFRIYNLERGTTTLQALSYYASNERPSWISLISGDDAFGEGYFEQTFSFIENNPDCALGFSKLQVCDSELSETFERESAWKLSKDAVKKQLQYSNPGNTPGVILPWKKIVQNGVFNSIPPILIEDYWLWWQLHDNFVFKNLNESKVLYRRHESNLTKQSKNTNYAFSLGYCTALPLIQKRNIFDYIMNGFLVFRWIRHISPICWSNFFSGRKKALSNSKTRIDF